METNHSKFWMGLGLGSIIGAVVYHFSCSSRGKQLKEKVRHVFHKASDNAEELMDEAKDKALQTLSLIHIFIQSFQPVSLREQQRR